MPFGMLTVGETGYDDALGPLVTVGETG